MVDLVGIGTVLGGLGGLFGRSRGPSPKDQAYQQLKGAFKAADEAGIHRLAVAGSPAGYSPAPYHAAEGIMQAGNALADYGRHRENRGLQRKQEQLLDAQVEEARSRTVLNQANARRALAGPQPGLGGVGGATQQTLNRIERILAGNDRKGTREPYRNMPGGASIRVGDGTYYYPNSEALEVGLSELMAAGIILGPQMAYDLVNSGGKETRRTGSSRVQPPRRELRPSRGSRDRRN